MAVREYPDVVSATGGQLSRYLWSDSLHHDVRDKFFFTKHGFVGPDVGGEGGTLDTSVGYPIVEKTELGKGRGKHIELPLLLALTGSATVGVTAMVDTAAEEALLFEYRKAYIETIRHATGYIGDMSEVRNTFLNKDNAVKQLTKWLAEQEEQMVFDAFYRGNAEHVAPSSGTTGIDRDQVLHPNWYGGGDVPAAVSATVEDAVDSNDTMGTAELERMGVWFDVNKIDPVRVPEKEGFQEGFIALLHPYQFYTLRQDPVWQSANENAGVRGFQNPLFTGAKGLWNGIFIYTSTLVENAETGRTDRTSKRKAIFFGANAILKAIGVPEAINPRQEDDYGLYRAWAISKTFGYARLDWIQDIASGPTTRNQSSAIMTTWAADPV